ncbi:MAG: hypothetical protein GX601_00495 [Anaerolineales bacterium]|nr:hypothetical protein [Anaerolineales bacterium]
MEEGNVQQERVRDERPVRRGGLVGPLVLIGAGVILLLNTLGVLDWSIWWSIIRLWPLLLVAGGVDLLIGRRTVWGSLVALVLVVAVLAGGVWLVYSGVLPTRHAASQTISQELGDAESAKIVLLPAAGDIQVGALSGSPALVQGQARQVGARPADQDFEIQGSRATFTLRNQGEMWWTPGATGLGRDPTWSLGLSTGVPLDVELELGIGSCDLDLGLLQVSSVSAKVGIGRCVVTFPSEGRIRGTLDGAIGQTVIVIPAGMEARIKIDTGITVRQIPDGFEQVQEDVYVTSGYRGADDVLELEVEQAIGSLRIERASGF